MSNFHFSPSYMFPVESEHVGRRATVPEYPASRRLLAKRSWVGPDGVASDQVVMAYLRGNVQAFMSLREAIDKALALASPAANGTAIGDEVDIGLRLN
jgi:hypothetical protein